MGKENTLKTLATVGTIIDTIAQGDMALIDIMPQLMQASDMLDEAIQLIEGMEVVE